MQNRFWNDKRVLITGASGFIGSQLVRYVNKQGAKVMGPKRADCDFSTYDSVAPLFKKNHFDICYHLAANPLVESGQKEPFSTLKNNFLATLNILELCRIYEVKRIIITSTVHVYGAGNAIFHEECPPKPSRPYETSKTCADLIAQSYADTFRLPVLIPRFVNIYGPGDLNFTRVIPKTIRSVLHKEHPLLWGGKSTREYLYVEDALTAFDSLAQMNDQQIEKNRIYNFGTGHPISARNLIEEIIRLSQADVAVKMIHEGREDELPQQRVSWRKAKRVLGWVPGVPLEQGLMMTIDWYRQYITMRG